MARVRILVTNDDGIASPGFTRSRAALRALGEVWVVAPDRERTAVGHAVTLHKPLRITKMGLRVFMVNGTPVDCVNLALAKILPRQPALIVSGINQGVNLGDDVMYSGTVSAALEGTILGIPSMAVSQEGEDRFRFEVGAQYAARVAAQVLAHGLPPETILNVNIPNVPFDPLRESRSPVSVDAASRTPSLKKLIRGDVNISGLPAHENRGAGARMPITKRWSSIWCLSPQSISIRPTMTCSNSSKPGSGRSQNPSERPDTG